MLRIVCITLATATKILAAPPQWCITNAAPGKQAWQNYNWDTKLTNDQLETLAGYDWTCGNEFGCSKAQETCWLSFKAKGVELHAHVNLQGDSNMPFDNVTDKPKKIITLAKKPETSTGQNDSIIKLVPACQPANGKVLATLERLANESSEPYVTLLRKLHNSIPY